MVNLDTVNFVLIVTQGVEQHQSVRKRFTKKKEWILPEIFWFGPDHSKR
jgi:hypothetical protein